MAKYKVGQQVKIIGNHYDDGTQTVNQSNVGKIGTVEQNDFSNSYPYYIGFSDIGYNIFIESDLAPVVKSLETLEVGDVVLDRYKYEKTVLAVLPNLYALSWLNDPESFSNWWTLHELQKYYTLKDTTEPVTTELTPEAIAEKFGLPVDEIRIKENK